MQSSTKNTIYYIAFTSISVVLYFLFAYFLKRENTLTLFTLVGLLAGLYYFMLKQTELLLVNYNQFVVIAFCLRLLFLFSTPALSDDFYRFIWDGRIIGEGLNPFGYLPNQMVEEQMIAGASNMELFQKMNSRNYYSVYPPLLQFLFFISAKLSFGYNTVGLINLRLFVLFAEFGTFLYLKKIIDFLKIDKAKIFLYLLNPLIIIELTGNLHFEAVMIFFLTASFYFLLINRYSFSAIFIAFAVATKLIPLIFLPLIIKKIGWKNGLLYSAFSIGLIVLMFLPFIDNQLISNVGDSLSLYFQKFEFNASVYYLLREIGYKVVGYNAISLIGKVLPIISTCLILFISFRGAGLLSWQAFFQRALIILFAYYLLSLVVHPWYVSVLVLISVFSKNRFAILWSILVFGSYFAYGSLPFKESLLVNAIEYTTVILFFIYECKNLKTADVLN